VKLRAQQGEVELVRAYPEKLEELVADKRACKQILINLLSNAIKFTPAAGRVTISARIEGNSILIRVADTGIGLDARDLTRIGDPFFQAHPALDRPYEGTGLGLSVVRGLVGLHGGTISVESEPNKGTCVSVRLPLDCRRVTHKTADSAKIETIARRSQGEIASGLFKEMMVKKIA
jgi:cell cycle sensor histidine kinase DivJ